jgi:hypothetical protein
MMRHSFDASIEPDRLALIMAAANMFYNKMTDMERFQVDTVLKRAYADGTVDYNDKTNIKEFIRLASDDADIVNVLE